MYDMSEPWAQAERLAARADAIRSRYPTCAGCGKSITAPRALCIRDEYYCRDCVEALTEDIAPEEEDYLEYD